MIVFRGPTCALLFVGKVLVVSLLAFHAVGEESDSALASELKRLSQEFDFTIQGLDKTVSSPLYPARGDLRARLQRLLADFSYVMMQGPDDRVSRVIIVNQKRARPPNPGHILLNTERRGAHHTIQATILGEGRASIDVPLLVDTGASLVVLPTSMIEDLGIDPKVCRPHVVHTANGEVSAKIARIRGVQLGSQIVPDVDVAFIDDHLLGGNRLLGMSVLGRYQMTIDDTENLIILVPQ